MSTKKLVKNIYDKKKIVVRIVINKSLSLAYGQMERMPNLILLNIANQLHILDLSYNNFTNLSFLSHFSALETLVLDRNFNLNCDTLPRLTGLRELWLNNCNIVNTNDWLHKLRAQCPNLRHLSMMCNPVGYTLLNGVTEEDEHAYRQQVLRVLPQLKRFDGVLVTEAHLMDLPKISFGKICRRKLTSFFKFPKQLKITLR